MRRILFHIAAATSLLLLIALCILWPISYKRGFSLGLSRTTWPSTNVCVRRFVSVRLVLGHCLINWTRADYDLTVPDVTRFHHAMDVPTFRKKNVPGMRFVPSTYEIKLGPQPPIVLDGQKTVLTFVPDG